MSQECWYENHVDEVGAINILDHAMAMLANASAAADDVESNQGPDPARLASTVK